MTASTKFYILTIVLLVIAFLNVEALGPNQITVNYVILAIIAAYLGWRTEDA